MDNVHALTRGIPTTLGLISYIYTHIFIPFCPDRDGNGAEREVAHHRARKLTGGNPVDWLDSGDCGAIGDRLRRLHERII